MLVAYRDGEPAVVRANQMDQLPLAALDLQRLAFAGVCGIVPLCNSERAKNIFFFFFFFLVAPEDAFRESRIARARGCMLAAVLRAGPNAGIMRARSHPRNAHMTCVYYLGGSASASAS